MWMEHNLRGRENGLNSEEQFPRLQESTIILQVVDNHLTGDVFQTMAKLSLLLVHKYLDQGVKDSLLPIAVVVFQPGRFSCVGVGHQAFNLDEKRPNPMVFAGQRAEHSTTESLLELKISLSIKKKA